MLPHHIIRYIAFFSFLLLQTSFLYSSKFQWPIPENHAKMISSTFGESRLDHFHAGVDIPGKGLPVIPMKKGKPVYIHKQMVKPNTLPFGGGNTVILEHDDFSWSVYMHLDSLNEKTLCSENITSEGVIGKSGNSGHSGGAHLHFGLYYPKESKIINPLVVLPKKEKFYSDEMTPEIVNFGVKLPKRFAIIRDIEKPFTLSKDYGIYALIDDAGRGRERWGIFSLKVYKNGISKPVMEWDMSTIYFRNEKWRTRNGMEFSKVFHNRYYYLGNWFRDARKITVHASGLDGPSIKKEYDLTIIKNQ